MTPRARPAPKRAKQNGNREKIGKTPHDPTRPIGKNNPPRETQFAEGNRASVGHGRPRKIDELKELIYEILAEDLISPDGRLVGTRAQTMVRIGLTKNPLPFLEYAFGKVKQQIDVNDVTGKPDSELVDELFRLANDIRTRTGAGADRGTPAAGTGGDGATTGRGEAPAD